MLGQCGRLGGAGLDAAHRDRTSVRGRHAACSSRPTSACAPSYEAHWLLTSAQGNHRPCAEAGTCPFQIFRSLVVSGFCASSASCQAHRIGHYHDAVVAVAETHGVGPSR